MSLFSGFEGAFLGCWKQGFSIADVDFRMAGVVTLGDPVGRSVLI